MMRRGKTLTGQSIFKKNLEMLTNQNQQLKQKLEKLERENRDLKKSVYQLTTLYTTALGRLEQLGGDIGDAGFDFSTAFHSPAPPQDILVETSPATSPRNLRNPRPFQFFHHKYDLTGHAGSVYTVKFSPKGALLASGSFDKTVRVWDLERRNNQLLCLDQHQLNVTDLAWSQNSTQLLSGAYDGTVRLWNVQDGGKLVESFAIPGFAQAVAWDPSSQHRLFFVGSTHNKLVAFDVRTPKNPVLVFENDAMVNTFHVFSNGVHLLTGDSHGCLKTWDRAMNCCVQFFYNDPHHKPVSHLQISRVRDGGFEGQFLAVNSYDNVLRVYDTDAVMQLNEDGGALKATPIHEFKGHKNKNWPIKCAFYCGRTPRSWHHARLGREKEKEGENHEAEKKDRVWRAKDAVFLATGSADSCAYLFDVGAPSGTGVLQRMTSHKDRVYAVDFHPSEPILATCSADFSVKIWREKHWMLGSHEGRCTKGF